MNDLTAFQRDLLRVIGGMDKPIGLEVKEEVADYYSKKINHGRLYPNLDSLVDKGLVHKEELDGRSNTYELSRRGHDEIKARDQFNKEYAPDDSSKKLKTEA